MKESVSHKVFINIHHETDKYIDKKTRKGYKDLNIKFSVLVTYMNASPLNLLAILREAATWLQSARSTFFKQSIRASFVEVYLFTTAIQSFYYNFHRVFERCRRHVKWVIIILNVFFELNDISCQKLLNDIFSIKI